MTANPRTLYVAWCPCIGAEDTQATLKAAHVARRMHRRDFKCRKCRVFQYRLVAERKARRK